MAQRIELFVIVTLFFTVLLWRNYGFHPCWKRIGQDIICIHRQMYFGVKPLFFLDIPWLPSLAPAAWGCTFDMAGVDHQPFIIRFINQNFSEFFPNAFSAPTNEPLMNAAPLPVIGRQVSPGRSGSQYPKHRVDKTAVILGNSAPLAPLSRQMWFKQCPLLLCLW